MQNTVDNKIDFFLFEKGEDIKINGVLQRAMLLDAVDKINEDADKIIHCKAIIKTGDVIEYIEQKYLITSQIDINTNSYSAKIKQCNYKIAFNFNGNIKWFDALIETKVMDINTNQFMAFPVGKIRVSLQDNSDSRDVSLGNRFINTGRAFETIGIDKSNKGIIILTCNLVFTTSEDDLINEIESRYKYEIIHTYVLNIINGSFMDIQLNNTAQMNIDVTDNKIAMTTLPELTYLSSDSNIVVVDNNGKIMGINPGTATITCQMTYKNSVKATIIITVGEILNHVNIIAITGSNSIKMGLSQSYVAHIYDNGNEVFDKSAIWSLRNQDGTGTLYATLTSSTGNGATIKGIMMYKNVILKAVLSDDSAVFKEFVIQVKGIL